MNADERRIPDHPILDALNDDRIAFTWNGRELSARRGEVISSALYAAGISVFGHHHGDVEPRSATPAGRS